MKKIIVFVFLIVLLAAETESAADSVVIIGGFPATYEQLEFLHKEIPDSVAVVFDKFWPISEAAADVLRQLKEKRVSGKMILVGHSWGGLVAREIDMENPGLVQKIITIGSPFGGFKMTPKLIYGVEDKNSYTPLYVIAGYNSSNQKWFMKSNLNDGTVDLDSATDFGRPIEGLKVFAGLGHMDLIKSDKVAQQVKDWIAQ